MDFRQETLIEDRLREIAAVKGYTPEEIEEAVAGTGRGKTEALGVDHNYCLNYFHSNGDYAHCPIRPVVKLSHRESGRVMKLSSTTPGV